MSASFGVDLSELSHLKEMGIVPGRTLHIDGDFVAYFFSFNENDSWEQLTSTAHVYVDRLMKAAGAEYVKMHLTCNHSLKGGRSMTALQAEYQGQRSSGKKPTRLESMRLYLRNTFPSSYTTTQEADDTLAQAMWEAQLKGERNKAVLWSKDKDLRMVQGLHLSFDGKSLFDVNGFGSLQRDGNKLIGTGMAFFWAQMIMGDKADNIVGVPRVRGDFAHAYKPTKQTCKLLNKIQETDDPELIQEYGEREISAGPAFAYEVLKDVRTNKEAFFRVGTLYKHAGPYIDYRTYDEVSWQRVFTSEAILLWMRRTPDQNDITKHWLEVYNE